MALNRASDVPTADWLYQHMKNYDKLFFMCADTLFLSDGNRYKALQFI